MRDAGLGDLARSLGPRLRGTELKAALTRAAQEMTTGRHVDPAQHRGGDAAAIAAIRRDLARIDAWRLAATEAAHRATAVQATLEVVQDTARALVPDLLSLSTYSRPDLVDAAGREAAAGFAAVVGALNVRAADRPLMAGTATGGTALAPAGDMLDALAALAAGEPTLSGIEAIVDAWFEAPSGGFFTSGYRGGPEGEALPLGPGLSADAGPTAADPALRATLKGLALAAMLDRGALAGDPDARGALARRAGERLAAADGGIVALRARVGASEERIAMAETRGAAEATSLRMAELDLVAADPFEAAARLEEARLQLEQLYIVTARVARLSLVEVLR
jgi:flagellar hook-associated protein 3 FlgL